MTARVRLVCWLFLVFVCGLGSGVLGTLSVVKRAADQRRDTATWNAATLTWLSDGTGLRSEQHATVAPAVDRAVQDLISIQRRGANEATVVLERLAAEVNPHLDEDQRRRLQTLVQERAQMWKAGRR